jgi:magnesium transporter
MVRPTNEMARDLRDLILGADPAEIADRISQLPAERIAELIGALHPADSAEVFDELEPQQQREVLEELAPDEVAEMLSYLDVEDAAEAVSELSSGQLADILDEMEPDDAADILGELDEQQAQATLAEMDEAEDVESLLDYAEESAGGLMTRHVVTLRASASVSQALALLRSLQLDEEVMYYLFVTDDQTRLQGVVSLRQLVTADLSRPLAAIMNRDVISVPVTADREVAAQTLARYGLLVLPTVDEDGRLQGVITADDVIEVIQEEATEDIYRLAGLDANEDVESSILESARRRTTWLALNLPTAMLVGVVVGLFSGTLEQAVVLTVFLPIIAGMGGNAGTQTLTLIVRSMALGELTVRDSVQRLLHEATVGLINGVVFGTLIGLVGWLWQGLPVLGLVAATAMLANMVMAALAGTLVPLLLRRIGADPALASGVLVTTATDLTGYTAFLGMATLLLQWLT